MALDYYTIDDALAEFDPTESVAFLHGSLMARLLCGERLSRDDWLRAVSDLLEIETTLTESQADMLQSVYDDSLAALPGPGDRRDGPMPLLPDEQAPLADRLEALADWCAAFVSTLGIVGRLAAPDSEDQELLSDLIAISQLDSASAADEDQDDPEGDYAALVAYARLAGRHFYERFAPPSAETPMH